ncbi:HD domain-containing protein [Lacinutrix undariae]
MKNWLKEDWYNLTSHHCKDRNLVTSFWNEIEIAYTQKSRYYHNLQHIYSMLKTLKKHEENISNLTEIKYAIWYHDIIYNASKSNNEEKSAEIGASKVQKLGLDINSAKVIETLILSTKKHQIINKENTDNAYLLDLDLSVLGTDWETYKEYTQAVRKEYKIYPDFLYNPGRKKVLNSFLERAQLFFTDSFKNQLELKARENIKKELKLL